MTEQMFQDDVSQREKPDFGLSDEADGSRYDVQDSAMTGMPTVCSGPIFFIGDDEPDSKRHRCTSEVAGISIETPAEYSDTKVLAQVFVPQPDVVASIFPKRSGHEFNHLDGIIEPEIKRHNLLQRNFNGIV